MVKIIAAIAIFATALPTAAFDLKGLRVGMTLDEAKVAIPGAFDKCREGLANQPGWSCYYSVEHAGKPWSNPKIQALETFAGRPVKSWLILHDGAKLTGVNVTMKNGDFDHVLAALTEKWGKPKSEASTVHNRMGASFDQLVATWTDQGNMLRARKRAGSLDEMAVNMTTVEAMQQRKREADNQAKDAAKDL